MTFHCDDNILSMKVLKISSLWVAESHRPRVSGDPGFFIMTKVVFFIDGFNLYHALNSNRNYFKYKWTNLSELSKRFITSREKLEGIYYFTALTPWSREKRERHKLLIKALESRGINIAYGALRKRNRHCNFCNSSFSTYEEKQTDVNMAIYLFKLAYWDKYDKAIIVSGDSDLIPSIKAVKKVFPEKQIGVVIPIGRRAEELKSVCDFHMKMKQKHLESSMFDDELEINGGIKLKRPATWI